MVSDIFEAAWRNDPEQVRAAIATGADVNGLHPQGGTFPLQLACQGNAVRAVKTLLEFGADATKVFDFVSSVDGRRVRRRTFLMHAESREVAQLLVEAGADVAAADEFGWTPLVYAAHAGNESLVRYLLERGAKRDACPIYGGSPVPLLEFLDLQMSGSTGPSFAVPVVHHNRGTSGTARGKHFGPLQ
jgi:ankyrin repeat protein